FKNGVLPIVLTGTPHAEAMAAARSGGPMVVDLEKQMIVLPNGPQIAFEIDPYRRRALLLGLDEIGAILADDAADIAKFEAEQRKKAPWLHLEDGRLDRMFAQQQDHD